jgi:hypothetical protein
MKKNKGVIGLCFRCQYRAEALDMGLAGGGRNGPRYECHANAEHAVWSCYMFRPCLPLVVQRDKGDRRQFAGGMLSCRYHAIREDDCSPVLRKVNGGWRIDNVKK